MSDEEGTAQIEIRASWTPVAPEDRPARPRPARRGLGRAAVHGGRPAAGARGRHRHAEPPRSARPLTPMPTTEPTTEDPDESVETDATTDPGAPLLTLRDGLPPVVDTPEPLAEACAALGRGHRPGRDRRRARLRLPLLRPRLPDPAAPRGRRHLADRPDRLRLRPADAAEAPCAAPSGSCTPPPRTCPCLREVGLDPAALFDTELAGRLLGYPRVGLATLVEEIARPADAQGALRRRLVDPAAADGVARVRRARRRGARSSCATTWSPTLEEAGKTEWARQEFDHLLGFEPTVRVDAWRRTVRSPPAARPPRARRRPRAVGGPRRASPRERDVTPGRIIPDAAIVAAATAHAHRQAPPCWHQGLPRPRRRPLLRHVDGRARRGRRDCPRTTCRPAPRAATARRTRAPGPTATRSPTAASRLARAAMLAIAEEHAPAGREPAHPRLRAPGHVGAAGDPRRRRAGRRPRSPAAGVRRPAVAARLVTRRSRRRRGRGRRRRRRAPSRRRDRHSSDEPTRLRSAPEG